MNDAEIGPAIRDLRDEHRLSQAELAEVMLRQGFRWHQTTVVRLERGTRTLTYAEGTTLRSLYGFDGDNGDQRGAVALDALRKIERIIDQAALR